jgi:hypothetical protein
MTTIGNNPWGTELQDDDGSSDSDKELPSPNYPSAFIAYILQPEDSKEESVDDTPAHHNSWTEVEVH